MKTSKKLCYLPIAAIAVVLLIQACAKSGQSPKSSSNNFDRAAILTNLSTNIIVPNYVSFGASVTTLDSAVTAFNAAPDAAKLTALQTAFINAYKKWQTISVFDLGPADAQTLRISLNTFPADVTQINNNVSAANYNLAPLSALPAQGFPALDYLLFGTGADNAAILVQFTTDAKAANRKTYLATVSSLIKTKTSTVVSAWTSTYPSTFINASGTDVGSSLGQLTNELNEDFEILKNYEIGIPAGTQSMGTTFPTKVQAYYSRISVQLALIHLQTIQNVYEGNSAKGNGPGFDDWLTALNAKYNGGLLNDAIMTQFAACNTKLQGLTDPLSTQINTNLTAVTTTYTALELQTVLLKTDMPSALGILITYGDTDGD